MELRVTRQRKMACVVHIRAWELGASYSSWLIISFSTPCRGGYSSQYRMVGLEYTHGPCGMHKGPHVPRAHSHAKPFWATWYTW